MQKMSIRPLGLIFMWALLLAMPPYTNAAIATSPAFVLDTRLLIHSSGAGISPAFVLDTRLLIHSSAEGVSAAFKVDTRNINRVWRDGIADVFVVDTRTTVPSTGLSLTPSPTMDFGAVEVGKSATYSFTLRNGGTTTVNGFATTVAPFQIQSGTPYVLAPNATQTIVVRYTPSAAGKHSAWLICSGPTLAGCQMVGTGYADTVDTGTIKGVVSDKTTGLPLSGVDVSVSSASDASSLDRTPPGTYILNGVRAGNGYVISASKAGSNYIPFTKSGVSVTSGGTTTVNIQMVKGSPPPPDPKAIPVVLVRGYRSPFESSNETLYWKAFRDNLVSENFKVWDCNTDGELIVSGLASVSSNAQQLKAWIQEKITEDGTLGPNPKINIVAHSMGGLVTRGFVALNKRNPICRIDKVIMLSTPNAGSHCADFGVGAKIIAPGALGPHTGYLSLLIGPPSPALSNLTTDYCRKEISQYAWDKNIKLHLLAGTNAFSNDEFVYKVGNAIIKKLAWEEDEVNDGMVTEPSSYGKYWKFETDIWPPSMGLVEKDTFPQGTLRYKHAFPVDHTQMKTRTSGDSSLNVFAKVRELLTGNAAMTASVGTKAKQSLAQPALQLQQIDQWGGETKNLQQLRLVFPSNSTTKLEVMANWSGDDVAFKLVTPAGKTITPSSPSTNPKIKYTLLDDGETGARTGIYEIQEPLPGEWKIALNRLGTQTENVPYSCMAYEESPLMLLPMTKKQVMRNEQVSLLCGILDTSETPSVPILQGALATTILTPAEKKATVALFDDGLHDDKSLNDGLYGITYQPPASGKYAVQHKADFIDGDSRITRRVVIEEFEVSPEWARLDNQLVAEGMDEDADGQMDRIRLQCPVITTTAGGKYLLSAELYDEARDFTLHASDIVPALPKGTTKVNLFFRRTDITVPGEYGPWILKDLSLYQIKDDGTYWLDEFDGEFTTDLILNGAPSDTGIDQAHWREYR